MMCWRDLRFSVHDLALARVAGEVGLDLEPGFTIARFWDGERSRNPCTSAGATLKTSVQRRSASTLSGRSPQSPLGRPRGRIQQRVQRRHCLR